MRSPGHRPGGRGGDGHRVCSLRVRGRGVLSRRTGSEAGPHPPTVGAWAPARGCSRVKNGVPSRRPEPLGLGKAVSLHRAGTGDTLPLRSLPGPPSQGQEEQGTAPLHLHLRRGRGVREPSPGHLAGTGPPGLALGAREGATAAQEPRILRSPQLCNRLVKRPVGCQAPRRTVSSQGRAACPPAWRCPARCLPVGTGRQLAPVRDMGEQAPPFRSHAVP